MKSATLEHAPVSGVVAPLAGAWIEISHRKAPIASIPVAPLAGAWIEIMPYRTVFTPTGVAPLAGAWIEMKVPVVALKIRAHRTPRGCVD